MLHACKEIFFAEDTYKFDVREESCVVVKRDEVKSQPRCTLIDPTAVSQSAPNSNSAFILESPSPTSIETFCCPPSNAGF